MAKKQSAPDIAAPLYREVIETFTDPRWTIRDLRSNESPTCFNGDVRVRRYRITVEEIEEPKEVLGARLQELWDSTTNHHHWTPLKAAAAKIGYELKGRPGRKAGKL